MIAKGVYQLASLVFVVRYNCHDWSTLSTWVLIGQWAYISTRFICVGIWLGGAGVLPRACCLALVWYSCRDWSTLNVWLLIDQGALLIKSSYRLTRRMYYQYSSCICNRFIVESSSCSSWFVCCQFIYLSVVRKNSYPPSPLLLVALIIK